MSASGDEKKLRLCFETLITDIEQAQKDISQLAKNASDDLILQKLQKNIQTSFDKSSLGPSGNYLLQVLNKYHYNDQTKTFTFSLTEETLPNFLKDLKSYLSLFDACQGAWDGDLAAVKDFMDHYFSLKDASGPRKTTMLYSAARNNHMNIVSYLIETCRCSVNAQNEEYLSKGQQPTMSAAIGSTALHTACYQGHLQIVKYLIEHGGDYFLLNSVFETPYVNSQGKANMRAFFSDILLASYSKASNHVPDRTILQMLEQNPEPFSDCIWEYKVLSDDRWIQFTSDIPNQLQQALIAQPFQTEIQSKSGRDMYHISVAAFLRTGKNNELAWIRCRGSSLLNLRAYAQWQMMFTKHPTGVVPPSASNEVLQIPTKKIQLQTWYSFDTTMNFTIETAMNYRRGYLNMKLDFLHQEKILFDLEAFTFTNQGNTIEGSLRWIPKIITNDQKFTVVDNFKLPKKGELILLTVDRIRQAQHDQIIPQDIENQYRLKSEDALKNDDLHLPNTMSTISKDPSSSMIEVVQGDLLVNQSDVLVVCSSSRYLFDSIMRVGGKSLKQSFDTQMNHFGKNNSLLNVRASGQLNSKAVYFVKWEPSADPNRLCRSIEQLVTSVIETAAHENYRSIAFPAIGCGEYGCSVGLVAQTFVRQVQQELVHRPLKVLFVIQQDKPDIYDEFQRQLTPSDFHQPKPKATSAASALLTLGKGSIEIKKDDITKQEVDVIIGSSSSENLRQILLKAGGEEVLAAYSQEFKNNPNLLIISTPPGQLKCKRIFFLKWEPDSDEEVLRQSIVDMIWNLIQNVLSHNFTSIAFPAIGCGEHACSVETVVKTMVREMKKQIVKRKLPWIVKFIIHPNQQTVYDEFCRQLLSSEDESVDYQVPSTWQDAKDNSIRALVARNTDEFKSRVTDFDHTMRGKYKQIIKIERIQNERWYMQYLAHAKDFKKRLNEDTEQHLYHGCPEGAANAIMEDCFNRSFAGVNGIAYGVGVYFSANAAYSHGFTKINSSGERHMFIARVLIGKTTIGNSSMKTRPVGFDSTTDGKEIFVTYHDAQAYAEYLITYK